MKKQSLFSSKDKGKKLKCRLLQFLFGALRVFRYALHYFRVTLKEIISQFVLFLKT